MNKDALPKRELTREVPVLQQRDVKVPPEIEELLRNEPLCRRIAQNWEQIEAVLMAVQRTVSLDGDPLRAGYLVQSVGIVKANFRVVRHTGDHYIHSSQTQTNPNEQTTTKRTSRKTKTN